MADAAESQQRIVAAKQKMMESPDFDPDRPALGMSPVAQKLMDRHGLYDVDEVGPDELRRRCEEAVRDPEVQQLMREDPAFADLVDKLPPPNPTPKVDPDFPNPDKPEQHADGLKLQEIAEWLDDITMNEGFHLAIQAIPVDISAMGWMANLRAKQAMSDLPLSSAEGDDLTPEELERQRLVLQWLDAFIIGWKFHRDEESLKIIEGNRRFYADQISPSPRRGVNRKQRRKKR